MGLPYSRQINAAFDQVTPLVAAAYQVLQTTKNISILLLVIQVLTALFLALILIVLVGLLISVNPNLESERDLLVTPAVKGLCDVMVRLGRGVVWLAWLALIGGMAGTGAGLWWSTKRERESKVRVVKEGEGGEVEEVDEGVVPGAEGEGEGEDGGEKEEEEKK